MAAPRRLLDGAGSLARSSWRLVLTDKGVTSSPRQHRPRWAMAATSASPCRTLDGWPSATTFGSPPGCFSTVIGKPSTWRSGREWGPWHLSHPILAISSWIVAVSLDCFYVPLVFGSHWFLASSTSAGSLPAMRFRFEDQLEFHMLFVVVFFTDDFGAHIRVVFLLWASFQRSFLYTSVVWLSAEHYLVRSGYEVPRDVCRIPRGWTTTGALWGQCLAVVLHRQAPMFSAGVLVY